MRASYALVACIAVLLAGEASPRTKDAGGSVGETCVGSREDASTRCIRAANSEPRGDDPAPPDRFPELRIAGTPPDGFSFVFRDGPDFYLWYCEPKQASAVPAPGFGIYFGLHPQPLPSEGRHESGTVAGLPVTWIETRSEGELRRDALLSYTHARGFLPLRLHVFVHASSGAQLGPLLAALRELRFVEK
jgi:hypothetical protein